MKNSFIFNLKSKQIVEMIEKLGFQVCKTDTNKYILAWFDNNSIDNPPLEVRFKVKYGKHPTKWSKGLSKCDCIFMYIYDSYIGIMPSPSYLYKEKIIGADWGKLLHEIFGEEYDKYFLERWSKISQEVVVKERYEAVYAKILPLHLYGPKYALNEIEEYRNFLAQTSAVQNNIQEFCQ